MNSLEVMRLVKEYSYEEAEQFLKEGGIRRPQRRQIIRLFRNIRPGWRTRLARILKEPEPEPQPTGVSQGRVVQLTPSKPKRSRLALWIILGALAAVVGVGVILFILKVIS